MAGKELKLSVVLRAIDKATAPLRSIAQAAKKTGSVIQGMKQKYNTLRLKMNQAGFERLTKSLKNVKEKFGGVFSATKNFASSLAVIGGYISSTGASIYKLARSVSDYGDNAWKTSQKIGMHVEAWQEFRHAGEMSGVESEALSKGMLKLGKNIVEAANGNKTLSAWFKRTGVAFVDAKGKARSVEDVMMDLSEVYGKNADGSRKTASAMALMGRSGADLIPMLNSGRNGMKEMRQEARDLGIVMDEKTARGAEAFNDNVDRMMKVIKGLLFNLGSELIPIINDLVVEFRAWIEANRELIKTKIKEWVEDFKKYLPELKKLFFNLIDYIKYFAKLIKFSVAPVGGFNNALKVLAVTLGVMLLGSIASAIMAIISFGTVLLTTPVGWVLLGIAAAVVAVWAAFKHWDKIWPWIKKLGSALIWPFKKFGELVGYLMSFDLIEIGKNLILSCYQGFKTGWNIFWSGVKMFWNSFISFFKGINLLMIGAAICLSLWNGLKNIWQLEIKGLSALWDCVVSFFKAISLYDIGVKIFTSLWDGMKSIFKGISSWASGLSFSFGGVDSNGIPHHGMPPAASPAAPLLLPQHPRSQPMAGRVAAAKGMQQTTHPSKAAVQVEFVNLPKGTRITTKKDREMDLATKVKMGPAMATP